MTVHLVGAGPGDPDLLTLRAARLLGDADVVVHDRLVSPAILELVSPWATCIDVGKDPNGARTTQARINDILVHAGRAHATVVRLKGGDPYVFGRGGEEALALQDAGIAVEIVPGISSAIAGPAAAGIPVTHRSISSGFTVVTAHQATAENDSLDWNALATLGTTLVVLMGAARAARIRSRLLAGGMDAATPVAIVTDATNRSQRVTRLRLSQLGRDPVANPSVLVIGPVAALDLGALPGLTTRMNQPSTHHSPHYAVAAAGETAA